MQKGEQKYYLEALIYIASIDGTFDEVEKTLVLEIGEKLGISGEETETILTELREENRSLEMILSGIESEETKFELLNMLIALCHADGKYSKAEKNGVAEIGKMLNVEGKTVKKLEMEYIAEGGQQAFRKGVGAIKSGLSFVGEKGVAGGKFVATGIGKAGSKLSDVVKSAKRQREENKTKINVHMQLQSILG